MYECKIGKELQTWLDDASYKSFVIKEVRQCGKTSSVVVFPLDVHKI